MWEGFDENDKDSDVNVIVRDLKWKKAKTCRCCESILLVEGEDVNYKYLKYGIDGYDFQCPVCGVKTNLEENEINGKVILLAMKKYLLKLKNIY